MQTRKQRGRPMAAAATALALAGVVLSPVTAQAEDGTELLTNPTFDGTLDPWWASEGVEFTEAPDGTLCGVVPGGGNQWDVIVGQGGVPVTAGDTFTISVTAAASPEASARVMVPDPETEWPPLYYADITLRADGQTFTEAFDIAADAESEVQLQLGGNAEDFELCLDEVSLLTGGEVEEYEPETGPRVRVNQVGYLPDGPKNATLVTDATSPVAWELRDSAGTAVASGETTPEGTDPSAGLNVHTVDFSGVDATGDGFVLAADGEESYPFEISATIYDQLRADSLGIYYTQRSGQEIVPVEVDGEQLKTEYARPAGHVSEAGGDDVNQGDVNVPCLPPEGAVDNSGNAQLGGDDHYGENGWACPEGYAIDASGGWYDAGDHGKYVVNSGISVYQLLSTYERSLYADTVSDGALGDSTLVIPERDNGVPDVLDEVRHNLDWMLSMQVDDGVEMTIDGEQYDAGGLAHHKLHDIAWTGMNLLPHEDPMPRYVHRPSTAATLNLAAAAAQGARLYADHDQAYADELLDAARRAWDAASAHPDIIAPDTNSLDPNPGGGPYNDSSVGDEFYWAAAQLFLTTGETEFADAVQSSPYHVGGAEGDIWRATGFDWGFTAAAARLDLATVPNALPGRDAVVDSVIEGADRHVATQQDEPFGHAYDPGDYDWGSNHQVINNAVIIATAYDLTGEAQYRDAALETFDYVLGRNALNNSYVKGYGTQFSQNMHNRWMASADRLPPHPDGMLAAGPNSAIQDPIAQEKLQGCAPQFCYIDEVDSWSTNEMTINWNAPLSWFASWADDVANAGGDVIADACTAELTVHSDWGSGFHATVRVTAGDAPLSGWTTSFDLGQATLANGWNAEFSTSGSQVTASDAGWNGTMAEGGSTEFGFVGSGAPPSSIPVACSAG
ncbi:glycoside hydrolase family 9 protein [Myceligenerans xiligouense]|uniref:Endoglucanase n=1 Tax=Myceligenerans xiligouense TaxID=253184 RepID=A0A3N4ZCA8_9MICO|nr:glycoside hydrolase family 9 protein [Myceligenerans xiligouense]RPF23102.1 endoglucanase [Myceligenerans xiligouense]